MKQVMYLEQILIVVLSLKGPVELVVNLSVSLDILEDVVRFVVLEHMLLRTIPLQIKNANVNLIRFDKLDLFSIECLL